MQVEMRAIGSIRPYENNPRHNDAAVDAVAASIREYGFRQPVVVDEAGVLIVGHTRYKAALKLGAAAVTFASRCSINSSVRANISRSPRSPPSARASCSRA